MFFSNKSKWISGSIGSLLLLLISVKVHAKTNFPDEQQDSTGSRSNAFLLKFSGYVQPQFQIATSEGIKSFSGGNFPENVSNRMMLRRGRVKVEFSTGDLSKMLQSNFIFQIDATERGVLPRDIYGEVHEHYLGAFSLTAGLFVRPFGNEVTYSSQRRESPERGRMSQLLMKTERDVGAMLTIHPKSLKGWQMNLGIFNGPGLSAPADYDNVKDVIGRLKYQTESIADRMQFAAGISGYYGGLHSDSSLVYRAGNQGNIFQADTATGNKGQRLPRQYAGADLQWNIPNKKGVTELRAEVMGGQQTGTRETSETPKDLSGPLAVRSFIGCYFYLLQHLGSSHHQLVLKYDFYDPNTAAKKKNISTGSGFNSADVAYQTFGMGYVWYLSGHLKLTAWYDLVRNEATSIPGYEADLQDDVFTLRLQYQF